MVVSISLLLPWREEGTLLALSMLELEVKLGWSFRFFGGDSWSKLRELRSQLLQGWKRVISKRTPNQTVRAPHYLNCIYLRIAISSCSSSWVLGCNTHLPLSISTRMSSSKSIFRSVGGATVPRWGDMAGHRSLNSAANAEDFFWDVLRNIDACSIELLSSSIPMKTT